MSIIDTTTLNAPTADVTLTPAQSGRTFIYTKAAAARVITLPHASNAQLYYRIICKSATGGQTATVTATPALNMTTQWRRETGVAAAAVGRTSIQFAAAAVEGDSLELISDGANWYAFGSAGAGVGFIVAP